LGFFGDSSEDEESEVFNFLVMVPSLSTESYLVNLEIFSSFILGWEMGSIISFFG